ncbi:hypothetical protein BESB_035590 [Besnoitia besnoiti]|uniref:Transmembrane protein n=1 Tax=Besnoitia besnoiti TaxID=94643 RepID=A0A2A9MLB2_BESBE|nr:hypothetical protein BESB_035590 [Besnoitia besnoiti]PFH37101.1 hypothetical protein BESB_035590 [Besnoitia besnoiti]
MSALSARLAKGAKWASVVLLGAGIPIGVAYFQVVYHNVEEEAQRLHKEGDLHRQRIREQWATKAQTEVRNEENAVRGYRR